jgi:hypothetical protein
MSSKERLNAVFRGKSPDQTPSLGGWIACPEHIQALAGRTETEYWADPVGVSLRAYRELGVDGLINIQVPARKDDFRSLDEDSFVHADSGRSLEMVIEEVLAMPGPGEILQGFDLETAYQTFAKELKTWRERCGDIVYMPAQWEAGAHAGWYWEFGYENFFLLVGEYPELAGKLMAIGGARGHCRGRLIARAVKDGLYPPAVLLGEDICTQRGPMVSPEFLKQYYAPCLRYGLEPLLDAGIKPVWHSDGDIRLIMDMLIDCGIQGFQGFQPECGMTLEFVTSKRTREGNPLLIFGPLSVTSELPVCNPEQVHGLVRKAIETCRGQADLVLFTSNTINPDVPLENVRALYAAVREADQD